jgi:ABC-type transport system involved in multi-copper enzyme maturation permease subunit
MIALATADTGVWIVPSASALLADAAPTGQLLPWLVLAVVLVAGLIVGYGDVLRLRLRRIWALSGICFTESMRRRVWLVTLLAIGGVIVVSQLQQASDDQDAIRQTIKFCLFASGLVVIVTALILASTNLPREIENRVIYTIVTKPTTRLEIILGKVLGFARVSAAILLIMGCFTYGYLHLRNHERLARVRDELAALPPGSAIRATLEHYLASGFLETKSLDQATSLNIYSHPPSDGLRWMRGGEPQFFLVHFEPSADERALLAAAAEQNAEVDLLTTLTVRRVPLSKQDRTTLRQLGLKSENAGPPKPFGPQLAAPAATQPDLYPALVKFRVPSPSGAALIKSEDFGHDPAGTRISDGDSAWPPAIATISGAACAQLAAMPDFFVEVSPVTPGVEYGAGPMPVVIFVPGANSGKGTMIRPQLVNGVPAEPTFLAPPGRNGVILTGHSDSVRSIADFGFHGASPVVRPDGAVAFQLDVKTERTGDFNSTSGMFAVTALDILNDSTGKSSGTIYGTPELNRLTLFDVPAADVDGGNFHVLLRSLTDEQWLEVQPDSVALITADRSFGGNLFKSFLLLWMLSTLVVCIAVFCSTFLSWPIAIVLTLVILLGRWGVNELGDSLNPGVGRMVSGDFQLGDPTESRVVSSAVETLSKSLRVGAVVLPDVSQFPATEDVERGISIPPSELEEAAKSLFVYGLTVIVGGYLVLRFKEVAP